MHPIYTMAVVTTLAMLAIWGSMLRQLSPRDGRFRLLIGMLCLGCFACPIAFFAIRRPFLIALLEPVFSQPIWEEGWRSICRDVMRLCFAPLTEEPAKLVPWLIVLGLGVPLWPARRLVAPVSLGLGLGFAVGEVWLVAWLIAQRGDPQFAQLPWYQFQGFLTERVMTGMAHTLFVFPTVWLARKGWKHALFGLAIGMTLHWFSNSAIVLMHREAFGWTKNAWGVLVQLWIALFAIAGLIVTIGVWLGPKKARRMWARRMTCPECGGVYTQPLIMGLNFGMKRYEPCGVCHKWHWVTLENLAPDKK